MNSLKLSTYFEVVKPNYYYYKLTPLKSLRNYNSDKIISTVSNLYKTLTQRIIRDNKKYFFSVPVKLSYYIFMEKQNVEFYFILPVDYDSLLKDKIMETWNGITIEKVTSIPLFGDKTLKFNMTYTKNDAFSLTTDKRNNVLLSSLMNTMHVMEQGDKVGIIYNFIPCSQSYWKADCISVLNKFKEGYPVEHEVTNVMYGVKLMAKFVMTVLEIVCETVSDLLGTQLKVPNLLMNTSELSNETRKKSDSRVVGTQIVLLSESENLQRANNNGLALSEAFKSINGDNELVFKRFYGQINVTDSQIKGADVIKLTALEGQNLLSLPGKDLIEEYGINSIETLETTVPEELQKGVISVGESLYRGNKTKVYLCNDFELRNLALCITGSNRSGKSTYISNIVKNCLKNGENVVIPDFCGNCELTNTIKELFPKQTMVLNCADTDHLEGLAYNEIDINEENPFKKYRNAKMQTMQLLTLVNAINDEDRALKAKMDRFLEASSLVTFISKGSINDVFGVLQSHVKRQEFISKIPNDQKANLEEYVNSLDEINEKNSSGVVIGTRINIIAGIIDRLTVLKKNTYFELMLKKDCSNNINFLKEIQKSQIICIQMPESIFATSVEKELVTLFYMTKVWLSLQLRKFDIEREKHVKVNIIIDEIYQVQKCLEFISLKLSQMPKFTAKMIVTCHYLNQIPVLRNELKASNASYMILQGSNVANFEDLKQEFNNLNYTVDDLLNLQRYHSLNLLSYEGGYYAGITKLPPPIK